MAMPETVDAVDIRIHVSTSIVNVASVNNSVVRYNSRLALFSIMYCSHIVGEVVSDVLGPSKKS